jgi:hypothetical protein
VRLVGGQRRDAGGESLAVEGTGMATVATVRERPILFSAPMVRAILEGRKTMTRRIVKPQSLFDGKDAIVKRFPNQRCCPYGEVGERLWVRETWALRSDVDWLADPKRAQQYALYRASYEGDLEDEWHSVDGWHPSIHLPRCLSRITLEITAVRVERLQQIGKDGRKARDVLAEGITQEQIDRQRKWFHQDDAPAIAFAELWESINGSGSWLKNPWVWVVSFKRI